jgi:preprotein translocase subunit SecE
LWVRFLPGLLRKNATPIAGVALDIKQEMKMPDKKKTVAKKPNAIARWWRETLGELRKVSWPTPQEAWRLTKIVIVVMLAMSALLGLLDFAFTHLIAWVLA